MLEAMGSTFMIGMYHIKSSQTALWQQSVHLVVFVMVVSVVIPRVAPALT